MEAALVAAHSTRALIGLLGITYASLQVQPVYGPTRPVGDPDMDEPVIATVRLPYYSMVVCKGRRVRQPRGPSFHCSGVS